MVWPHCNGVECSTNPRAIGDFQGLRIGVEKLGAKGELHVDFSWSSFSRHDVVVVAVVVVMEVVVSCFKDFHFNVRYLGKMNLFRRIYQFFRWVGSTFNHH